MSRLPRRYRYRVTAHIGEQMISVVIVTDPDNVDWHTTHVEYNNFDDTGWHDVNPDYVDSHGSHVYIRNDWFDDRRNS